MKFNINGYVRVRLTPLGLEKLKEEHEQLRLFCSAIGEFTPPKTDSEGYSKWQMWLLMQSLGQYCRPGSELPFETEIKIGE